MTEWVGVTSQGWLATCRWIQHKTGQSVKDGYNTQLASQSTMTFIFNTGPASPIAMGQQLQLASQIEMGNVTSGQSINHGDKKLTGHSVWDPMQASSGGPSYMGDCQVGWLV